MNRLTCFATNYSRIIKGSSIKQILLGFFIYSIALNVFAQTKGDKFSIHKSGMMVYDSSTELVWMRCSLGQNWNGLTCNGAPTTMSYNEALAAVSSLNKNGGFGGYKDWTLPDIRQLHSIVYCSNDFDGRMLNTNDGNSALPALCRGQASTPTVVTDTFPNFSSRALWSKTEAMPGDGSRMWGIQFNNGGIRELARDFSRFASTLLVRSTKNSAVTSKTDFGTEKLTSNEEAKRLIMGQWKPDNLKSEIRKFLGEIKINQNAYLVSGSGFGLTKNSCALEAHGLSTLMRSGASEIWARHGAGYIDELHSITEESMFWLGDCINGKANGEGIIVYYYQGKINTSTSEGAVRSVITVNNGLPSGNIHAYSNSKNCFNTCRELRYAKEIGRLRNGEVEANFTKEELEKRVAEANTIVGSVVGGLIVKGAEIIKEGAAAGGTGVSNSEVKSNSTGGAGFVQSMQQRSYDNVGRKTIGYDVRCSNGKKETIYRSAWDDGGPWYYGTYPLSQQFLAKGNLSVQDAANNLCR